jgi:recombination protein RecA
VESDEILAQLSPELRKLLTTGSKFVIEKQPTPSILLNKALGGGLAYGRQVLIYGPKSAGKSTFCLQMIADAQRNGKSCAWIDSEKSFDPEWARKLGVDTDQLIVSRANAINHAVDVACELMKAGVNLIVLDSISACSPAVFFDKNDQLKDLSDTKQMGSDARDWSLGVKMLNYSNNDTLLVLISQQRNKLGSMFVSKIPTGGESVKFFSSTIIRLYSSESEGQAIKGTITIGDRDIEMPIGREVKWLIDANKLGPSFASNSYNLLYDGPNLGVDNVEELATSLEMDGIVIKEGKWYNLYGTKYNGRKQLVKALREDEDLRMKATNDVL